MKAEAKYGNKFNFGQIFKIQNLASKIVQNFDFDQGAHFQLAVTSTKSQVVIVLHLKSCSYFVFQNWSKEGLLYKCFNYITFFC